MVSEEGRKYGGEAVAAAADPATWEIWPAPEGHREVLYQRFPEFTVSARAPSTRISRPSISSPFPTARSWS